MVEVKTEKMFELGWNRKWADNGGFQDGAYDMPHIRFHFQNQTSMPTL